MDFTSDQGDVASNTYLNNKIRQDIRAQIKSPTKMHMWLHLFRPPEVFQNQRKLLANINSKVELIF